MATEPVVEPQQPQPPILWINSRRKLRELIPWEHNPRQITQEQAARLLDSLDTFGQIHPICIGPANEIYDGHQRDAVWAASERYGPDYEVDVRVASRALTEKERAKLVTYEHGASQKNETLFTEYIRLLRGLKPKTFVAENVSGLVKGTAKGYFLEILAALKASGYRVACRVLDAQWLGVPQQRQRTIFVGVRSVPPVMMMHIAACIRDNILLRIPRTS